MIHDKHTIFRRKAWETYVGKQEQSVLPRAVTPPVFVFCWILFGLLVSAGSIAWWEEVPIYATGSGILLEQPVSPHAVTREMIALIFLPASHALPVQKGASLRLQLDKAGLDGRGQVERVEPGPISPEYARKHYQLNGAAALLITRPSLVVLVRVAPPLSEHLYVESIVSAQVPIGTEHLLTLLFTPSN
jgi:hypothetical protein